MFKVLRLVCQQRQLPSAVRQFSYKSDISTEALYPNSKQELFTPPPPPPVRRFGLALKFLLMKNM